MDAASGLECPEGRRPPAIAFEFPAGDPSSPSGSPPSKAPRRLRRRLAESKSAHSSVEAIEAKLREADIRRQQFHEWLSNKARSKPRSTSWSSQDEDHGQRLEAKLCAAEQKRLSLLQKTQMRLARLDELRQAAKTGVEMRFQKEREELGTKVESRIQHAEANRMLLLQAYMQRRAAVEERKAQSLLKRINRENKYKDLVRKAIYQKRAAAEKKRLGLLEAEKTRTHAKVMQARRVAKSVFQQREIERRRMKEELEDRLQRAKRQRAEYLRQRGSPSCSSHINLKEMHKHGDFLSRKLAWCWRQFVKLRKTTFALAKAYETLEISEGLVRSMPFEQLARHIESATTLETVKALLDRLESCLTSSLPFCPSGPENIGHLLKHVASPKRRILTDKGTQARGQMKGPSKELKSHEPHKQSRYPVRVVLCAYMILGHPDAVFSGHGEHEITLADSATSFTWEFELLISIILNGPKSVSSSRQSMLDMSSTQLPRQQTFRSQLVAFDAAWCSYLHCFVAWKAKDARLLEEDLVRAACQLELSMMQKCKLTIEGRSPDLSHDVRAIKNQVTEDHQLLREKVQHLSGSAGIGRLESALSNVRSKYFKVNESESPSMTPTANTSSSLALMLVRDSDAAAVPLTSTEKQFLVKHGDKSTSVVRSLFRGESSSPPNSPSKTAPALPIGKHFIENEVLVNEIVHQSQHSFVDNFDINVKKETNTKAKIKETMEKAFWDGVVESLMKEKPDYSCMIGLVKEIRDELHGMAPKSWKGEILDSIDLDILSQVVESRTNAVNYLGKILEYALGMLLKLSAPANEAEITRTHEKLLIELADIASQPDEKLNSSFVAAVVRGLRFVLEQIQMLKKEISKARIQIVEPIIRGPAGVEYLQKAFANRCGPPSDAATVLTLTAQWISSSKENLQEWEEHTDSLSVAAHQDLLPVTALRSGGSIPSSNGLPVPRPSTFPNTGDVQPECKGERVDVLVRLGLLKLVSKIEGLTADALPETLELNFLRLRNAQSQFQKIIVICTSVLVLRQTLLSENSASGAADVENYVSRSAKGLIELLDREPDVGIKEIISALAGSSSPEDKLQSRKEVMARVLSKSLQDGDAVFTRVSRAVYLAVRGVVLGGSGARGRKMAESALQRVGGAVLLDQVVEMSEVLTVMAIVSGQVHSAWYERLV